MFRIKICGITREKDALAVAHAGADAVGLNFYRPSPRFVESGVAAEISAALPRSVAKVGVFVNSPLEEIVETQQKVGLDFIQLHGDEPPEFLAKLDPLPVIRAFRMGNSGWRPIVAYVDRCREIGVLPAALLIDAFRPGLYGGTGDTADWNVVRQRPKEPSELPVILAGGLTPENVAEAIAAALPWGVDTASGVESSPGVKEAGKVRAFVAAAQMALHMA